MAQVLRLDVINPVTFLSTTTVQMAANSFITVGGQQYTNSSAIVLNAATVGANGLDTGSLAASSYYYVYAVQNVGALALVASLSGTSPTGFASSTWTGFVIVTDGSSHIYQVTNSYTVTKLLSGSGTYNTPSKAVLLKIRMVGAGGGGSGGGTTSNPGHDATNGTATTFGTSLLTANGGSGALQTLNVATTPGGTATISSPAVGSAIQGGFGNGGVQAFAVSVAAASASGVASPFGGSGAGATYNGNPGPALSAVPNTGSGGGGGPCSGAGGAVEVGGSSGAAGGYIEAIINNPSASYPYSIGVGGLGGAAGANGGGAGGDGASGVIVIEEHYKY